MESRYRKLALFFYDSAKILFAATAIASMMQGKVWEAVMGLLGTAAIVIVAFKTDKEETRDR